MRDRTAEIRRQIECYAATGGAELVRHVAESNAISRQAVHKHLQAMVKQGVIRPVGDGRSRRYELIPLVHVVQTLKVAGLEEDVVWREYVQQAMHGLARNEELLCHYGFTEMLNNAIDHSEGTEVTIEVIRTRTAVRIRITDNGVGIFQKIKRALQLDHERQGILELAKGKVTTDPTNHSGLGIFFTSRSFDDFRIMAGALYFQHFYDGEDWLYETGERTDRIGTEVEMMLSLPSKRDLESVFSEYSGQNSLGFGKTIVPLSLAQYGEDNLVSRSQAKRLFTRFDRFEEVVLDFEGVEMVGQAFADEIFRVFRRAHPNVRITYVRENSAVKRMIQLAEAIALQQALAEAVLANPVTPALTGVGGDA